MAVALPILLVFAEIMLCCSAGLVSDVDPGAGSSGLPYPSGTLTFVAAGDHPAARDFLTAAHLFMRSTASPKMLVVPKGFMHSAVQCEVDRG